MSRTARLQALIKKRPLVCDGAMGTQLQLAGLAPGDCGVRWNADEPDRVQLVYRRYREAGADLLTTNTFAGSSIALAAHGLDKRVIELNRAGAQLARTAAGHDAFVLGDMGPFGGLLEPYGDISAELAQDSFRVQAAALLEGGADAILVETMSDPAEAALAIAAARSAGATCVLVTYTYQHSPQGFRTMMGTAPADAVRAALEAGADIVGANCGTELSLADYERLTRELVAVAEGRPVIVQPNAGSPRREADRIVYGVEPLGFAEAGRRLVEAGAAIVGGCCGTSPEHIQALAGALKH